MKDINISEKLHMQFYKCGKLLKRNSFEQKMEHIKAVPYRGQGRILRLLLDKGEITQKDIALELDIRPSSAWEFVCKLERAGFVEKIPNPEDKRGTIVRLTEVGRKEAMSSKWDRNKMSDELFAALSIQEQHQLSQLLEKIIFSLKQSEGSLEEEVDDEFAQNDDKSESGEKVEKDFGMRLKEDLQESKRFFKSLFRDIGKRGKDGKCVDYEILTPDQAQQTTQDGQEFDNNFQQENQPSLEDRPNQENE